MRLRAVILAWLLAAAIPFVLPARAPAEEDALPIIRFEEGRFDPGDLVVKAQTPFRLRVRNTTKEVVEFESFELNRERVVQPGQEIVVYLPALDPGTYPYFDDFHHAMGQGTITAR
jgi:hypothetical protein